MTEPSRSAAPPVRCAQWSRAQGVDLVGTAGSYAGYVLVEWPLPWPRDAGEIEELGPLRHTVAGQGYRLQLVVPSSEADCRVALYQRPDGPFRAFDGRELRVPLRHRELSATADAFARAAGELLAGGGDPVAGCDVLVCTHGRRDRCCGSLGMELWQQVRACGPDLAGARVLRTSHTGGHRFAATCIVLPAGTLWGFLDADALRRIVRRVGPLDDLIERYRGCSGIGSPAGQALERAVLAEVGWSLFDQGRHVEELGNGRVRLTLSGPATTTAWEATVVQGRTHRMPDCGKPLELSPNTQTDLVVVDLRPVT